MRLLVFLMVVAVASPANGQEAPTQRRYLPDSSDEDWSFLAQAPRADVWDPLKYIAVGDQSYLTLSGEMRFRPEGLRIRASDTRPASIDNYLLQRYLFGADVHAGAHARVFAELQSGIINGALRSPRPTDRNTLDLHQVFFSWRQLNTARRRQFVVKVGRQELSVGSTRLISASPGLNVKRSFDGVSASYRASAWSVAGAAARLVANRGGRFDDRADAGQPFWGVAISRRSPRFDRGEMGAYYLGIDRRASLYHQGIGSERRHTLGFKWTGSGTRVDLNYDALFQWGTFAEASIRAWAFATESGFRPTTRGWRPRLSVRADFASGDRDPADPRLEAFNPLFPGNSYSGAVGLLGPTNLTDLTPALTLTPRRGLTLGFEAPSYWRTSTADGIYATDQRPLIPPQAGTGRYVGTNPGVLVVWQATTHWQFQGVITRFLSGGFLRDTFAGPGFGFYSVSSVYRF